MKQSRIDSLLFEIGVEEIPSGYFEQVRESILKYAPNLLNDCGWKCDNLDVLTTPRRIVIYATGFMRLPIQEMERLGPSKEQAYQNGKPTAALLGFLRGAKKSEKDVVVKDTPRGARVSVCVKKEQKPLRIFFEALPKKIEFPKLMRWEKTRYTFTRPIRWTFASVGSKKQTYTIGAVKSGMFTYGHRFLAPHPIRVNNSNLKAFETLLAKNHVILDPAKRIAKIKAALPKGKNGHDEELIETIAHLVEKPFAVRGSFDVKYLKLPASVLISCMSKQQRIFAQYSAAGKLTNRFIAILNGPRANTKLISRNYESVLKSRLEDARFFFEEDQKTKLEKKVDGLRDMIFLGSLGSYLDKTKRVAALASWLAKETGLAEGVIKNARRAAHLAKADLTTQLVYEFPELQGVAGAEYAKLDGEGNEVAKAIQGHYLPSSLSDDFRLLKTKLNSEGVLLGISDRIDLLVGASGLGIELSSSQDPYALRRAAGGIVKIIRAHRLRFSLSKFVHVARDQYGRMVSKTHNELAQKLIPFFRERIAFELQVKMGSRAHEVLQGIFISDSDYIAEIFEKFEALTEYLEDESFVRACKVMERTGNILKGASQRVSANVEPSLFENSWERSLHELIDTQGPAIDQLIGKRDYANAAKLYGNIFYQPVHDFFDQVMVNVEDEKVRSNRQALVKQVNQICRGPVADLSLVTNL